LRIGARPRQAITSEFATKLWLRKHDRGGNEERGHKTRQHEKDDGAASHAMSACA
jgi:hypothetical protein